MKNLPLADPNFGTPGEMDALFGINLWIKIISNGVIKSTDGTVAAQRTSYGRVIYKREKMGDQTNAGYSLHITKAIEKGVSSEIAPILEKFWQVEDIPTVKIFTSEEKECERIFMENHTRNKDGRYIVQLPFNNKLRLLGRSKSVALKQFHAMDRKMSRNEDFKNK